MGSNESPPRHGELDGASQKGCLGVRELAEEPQQGLESNSEEHLQRDGHIKNDGQLPFHHDGSTKRHYPHKGDKSPPPARGFETVSSGPATPSAHRATIFVRAVKDHLKENTSPCAFWRRFPLLSFFILGLIAIMLAALTLALVFAFHSGLATSVQTIVDLNYARYRGVKLQGGVTQWLGMRYAAPPVGSLRFQAPTYPPHYDDLIDANTKMPGCMGAGPVVPKGSSEDCLYVDVYAPSNANTNSKLPVFINIQGGGFNGDGGHFNGTGLIIAGAMNMVVVSFTYRGGALGFLAGKELAKGGSYNNGLKDQRRVFEWVQMHIAAFGGDPAHVTVGGQSAGAGSIVQHLTTYGGRDDKYFNAVVMESQSLPPVRTIDESQYQYDNLVAGTRCKGVVDTLTCLRTLSIEDLQKATLVWPFPGGAGGKPTFSYNPVIDGDMIRDYPVNAFATGKFIKVPTIFGDDTDEGTIFTPNSISSAKDSREFLKNNFPSLKDNDLAQYNTLYDFDDTNFKPYWNKAAKAYGETRYNCPGIYLSNYAVAHGNPSVWNFRFDVFDPGNAEKGLGVAHGAELGAVWGDKYYPTPPSYVKDGADVIPIMQNYWVSFIRSYDPNKFRYSTAPEWTPWSKGKKRVHFIAKGTTMEAPPPEQISRCAFIESIAVAIKQ